VLARAADRDHAAAVKIAARTVVEQVGHAKFPASAALRDGWWGPAPGGPAIPPAQT
jgi:hypothetical protein